MKRKILQIFSISILLGAAILYLGISNRNSASVLNGYYEYPDITGKSPLLIISDCRIPEDIQKAMTDEQLAQAVADFPLLIDIGAASSFDYGVKILPNNCDAYKELLTRANAKDALMSKLMELNENEEESLIAKYMLAIILMHEKSFKGMLTDVELEYVMKFY